MEKRYFLAIALSFLVIFGWSVLQKPQTTNDFESTQSTAAQGFVNKNELSSFGVSQSENLPLPIKSIESSEKIISVVENDKVYLEFSNIGAVLTKVVLKDYDYTYPISSVSGLEEYKNKKFTITNVGSNRIEYLLNEGDFIVSKAFEIDKIGNALNSQVAIENTSDMSKQKNVSVEGIRLDMSSLDKNSGNWARDKMLFEYLVSYDEKDIYRHKNAFKFTDKDNKKKDADVNWVGFRDRYFTLIMDPQSEVNGYQTDMISEETLSLSYSHGNIVILPKNTVVLNNKIVFAPQEIDLLKEYGEGYEKVVSYAIGGFFDIFAFGMGDPAAKILLGVLKFVHNVAHSWGFSIVIVALLVCGGTYPLTLKSMKSMQRMQQFQPELAKIKEKHEKNPQKVQQETMEFYKKNKINPFGGCLPMFLQMPIFFGVIQLLWRYVGLRGESFLWIKDLSEPDRLFILPISLPIIGNEINILPIIVFGLTILQQRFSGKNMVTADSTQAMQMKMMKFMLPALIILFFYKFASAMALYFTIFYVFSTYTQWKMAKERKVLNVGK